MNNFELTSADVQKNIDVVYSLLENANTLPNSKYKTTIIYHLKQLIAELTILNVDINLNLL